MSYQNKYRTRMNAYGGNQREATIINNKNMILSDFENSPAFYEVYINNLPTKTGVQIVSDTKTPTTKKLLMKPNDGIHAGDIIKWRDGYWLCMSDDPNQLYTTGFIERCNTQIKWIDENGFINEFPCVLYYNSRSSFGVKEDKIMTLPDGRRQAALQKNEHTSKIQRGKRFIIGGEAFKVIDYDSVSDKGIFNLSFESDQIDPATDNIELGIANYYSDLADYSISILNGEFASIEVNQSLRLNAQVKNRGNIIKNALITFTCSDSSIAEINQNGLLSPLQVGSVIVTASFGSISANINVTVTQNMTNNYSVDILGDDSMITGRTRRYRCQFKNNGIIYRDESLFQLFSVDGSDTTLASIIEQNPIENTCVINAGDKVGTIKLQVSNTNGLSVGSKIISIKPLF